MNKIIINSNYLLDNLRIVKKLSGTAKVCAVVKANAYGHGMITISKLLESRVDYFAVSTLKEAIELRKNNIKNNILILGYILPKQIYEVVKYDLEITVGSKAQLISYESYTCDKVKIHLKKDSGLHRYGYISPFDLKEIIDYIKNNDKYSLVGFYTHFVISDEDCEDKIFEQSVSFEKDVNYLKNRGLHPIIHAASSTTLFLTKKYQYDMVRIGMSLYGFCGFDECLKKVMSVKTSIVDIKRLNNVYIGYGEKQKIDKNIIRAIIPIGYGYGINSKISNKSNVIIHNKFCPIIGEMSMDCMYVDITNVPNVKIGDEVIFIGESDNQQITVTDHAKELGEYSCEILTNLNTNRFNIEIK